MLVLVSYDVSTKDPGGPKRLRRVARACEDFGQRVQNSVFECMVDPAQWVSLRGRLLKEADPKLDSLPVLLSWSRVATSSRTRRSKVDV